MLNANSHNFFSHIDREMTISWWSKGDSIYSGPTTYWPTAGVQVWCGGAPSLSPKCIMVHFPTSYLFLTGGFLWRSGDTGGARDPRYDDVDRFNRKGDGFIYGKWNHLAVARNLTDGTMKMYVDGELMGMETGRFLEFNPLTAYPTDTVYFSIGGCSKNPPDSQFNYYGRIDDVRVYNKELSQEEILYLAGVASIEQPLMLQGDANGDGNIDLSDYAALAEAFLSVQLWP